MDAGVLGASHIKYLESGDLKMVAVLDQERHEYAPGTKTLIEDGFDYYVDAFYYICAPKGLPANAQSALVKAFDEALHSEKVKTALRNILQATPKNLGSEGFYKMLTSGVDNIKNVLEKGQ